MNLKDLPTETTFGVYGDCITIISNKKPLKNYTSVSEIVKDYCRLYPEDVRGYLKENGEEQ